MTGHSKTNVRYGGALAVMMWAASMAGSHAQERQTGLARYAVIVWRLDTHPRSASAAYGTLARLDAAALLACGASDSSLAEVKRNVRSSPCWQGAMQDAVRRIGNAALTQAFARAYPGSG